MLRAVLRVVFGVLRVVMLSRLCIVLCAVLNVESYVAACGVAFFCFVVLWCVLCCAC